MAVEKGNKNAKEILFRTGFDHLVRAGSEQGQEMILAQEGPGHGPEPHHREGRKAARRNPSSRAGLRPVIDNNRNLRLKPALQAQSSSAILRSVLKEVLASTVYAASVAMANGWRAI